MVIDILGTEYEIIQKNYVDEKDFEKLGIDGYCNTLDKIICCGNLKTFPNWCNETAEYCEKQEKITLRHEIIHAFLYESGLSANSLNVTAWGTNEEMVDFFAIQFPKLLKAFEKTNCL